jgi:hypothetical protein
MLEKWFDDPIVKIGIAIMLVLYMPVLVLRLYEIILIIGLGINKLFRWVFIHTIDRLAP